MTPQELREKTQKLARKYFDQAGLKNDESKALFKLDLESFACEIRNEALEKAAKITAERCGTSTIAVKEIRALKDSQ